jgi:predicted acyltransferase
MPINKGLWTPSYVFYTGGLALMALGVCYWLIDVKGYRSWSRPAVIFGMNAIAIFVLSGIIGRLLTMRINISGKPAALKSVVYDNCFRAMGLNAENTSLAYAVAWILTMYLIAWAMYRMRVFVRV